MVDGQSLAALRSLTGPALAQYWNRQGDALDAAEQGRGQQQADAYAAGGDVGASIDQRHANLTDAMNLSRLQGMPDRRALLTSLSGKQVSGLGQPGFSQGRLAPGTTDVIEPVGPSYVTADFDDSDRDPGSATGFARGAMADRSGLSLAALRALSGKG